MRRIESVVFPGKLDCRRNLAVDAGEVALGAGFEVADEEVDLTGAVGFSTALDDVPLTALELAEP